MGHKLVIKKKTSPFKKLVITCSIIALSAISVYAGYFYSNLSVTPLEYQISELESQNQQLSDKFDTATKQLNESRLQARAATVAKEHLETTVKTLQSDNTKLNHDLSFYQRIMSPEKTEQGLQFADFQKLEDQGQTWLSAKIYQTGRHDRYRKGSVNFEVYVTENGPEPRQLTDAEVNLLIEGERRFQFRYFQTLKFKITTNQYNIQKIIISVTDAKKRQIRQELVWGNQ